MTTAVRRGRWFTQVGWRHLVALLALAFSLFPILFVVSAAVNPLGTLSSTELIPTGASAGELHQPVRRHRVRLVVHQLDAHRRGGGRASIFLSALAAYAFSRMRFQGRRVGLLALLLIQMFPQFLAIVAIFLIFTTVTDFWPAIGFNTSGG